MYYINCIFGKTMENIGKQKNILAEFKYYKLTEKL